MEKFEHYKNMTAKAVREGIEEHKSGGKKPYRIAQEGIRSEGEYKKVVAAVELMMELLPVNFSEKIKEAIDDKDYSNLPFDPDRYQFGERVGKGAVSKVHLLEAKNDSDPSYVLKLDYRQDGDAEESAVIAQKQHEEYELIAKNYQSIPGLIPKEQSFITTDKKDKSPVIATLQEFAGSNIRDFFHEIDTKELVELL